MGQEYSIWTPVVIGRLKSPQRTKEEKVYNIEKAYHSIEDIKVKVKYCRVIPQGQAIEAQIKIDILCLVEDFLGSMHLIAKEETVKKRIPLTAFDSYIDKEADIKYIINILNCTSQCELNGQILKVVYFIDFAVIATCEQIIKLSSSEEAKPAQDSLQEVLNRLRLQVKQMEEEKEELRRKIFFYERDISSLKKGLKKAENKNATLNKELENYLSTIEQLKAAIKEKEFRLSHYENPYYNNHHSTNFNDIKSLNKEEEFYDTNSLGSRIKRMFQNNN